VWCVVVVTPPAVVAGVDLYRWQQWHPCSYQFAWRCLSGFAQPQAGKCRCACGDRMRSSLRRQQPAALAAWCHGSSAWPAGSSIDLAMWHHGVTPTVRKQLRLNQQCNLRWSSDCFGVHGPGRGARSSQLAYSMYTILVPPSRHAFSLLAGQTNTGTGSGPCRLPFKTTFTCVHRSASDNHLQQQPAGLTTTAPSKRQLPQH
jgi:hypothetical protein